MAKKPSIKQEKALKLSHGLKLKYKTFTELFNKLEDKNYKWDRELKEWVNPGQVFQLSIKWSDDGFLEEIAESLIEHLQDEYEDHQFTLCNPDWKPYTPRDKDKKPQNGCEAITLYFRSETAKEIVTSDDEGS